MNSVILFAILCANSALGFFVHPRLPEQHSIGPVDRAGAARDLAFGHLHCDRARPVDDFRQGRIRRRLQGARRVRAKLAQMDRCLGDYGPQAAPIRAQLRSYAAAVIASTWPDEPPPTGVAYPEYIEHAADWRGPRPQRHREQCRPRDALAPNRRTICARPCWPPASSNIMISIQARWKVIEGVHGSISAPFYWVLAFWLALLFGTFCLTAPPNPLVVTVVALCARIDHRRRFCDPRHG